MASPKRKAGKNKHLSLEAVKVLFSKRVVAYRPEFARIGQGTALGRLGSNAGLFLSQAMYWTEHTTDPDGWFYKTQEEWFEETGLTEEEQPTARRILKRHGLMEEDLRGSEFSDGRRSQGKLHYRVDLEAVRAALEKLIEDAPKLAEMEAQRKREKAQKRREKLAAKKRQGNATSEHVPGNAGNMSQTSNSSFCSTNSPKHAPGNAGDMFPVMPDTGLYIKTTNKNTGTTSSNSNQNFGEEISPQSDVDDVDKESFKNGKLPILGQINASDEKLARTNKRATKQNAAQTAADAGQPLLSGATLSPVKAPENGAGDSELLAQLLKIGVSARPAQALIAEFPDETARQVEYWPYQDRSKIPNPGGWFVSAVKGAYAAPPAYTKARDAEIREENLRAQRIEEERQREAKRAQMEAEEQQNQELDAEFAAFTPDEQKEADAEILRINLGIEYLLQNLDAKGRSPALAVYRRQLLRSGWEPGQSTSRFLDAQCSESALDAAVAQLPDEVAQEIEARITKEFEELGMDAKPDSKPWLSRKRGLLRQMLKSGVLQLPAQVKVA